MVTGVLTVYTSVPCQNQNKKIVTGFSPESLPLLRCRVPAPRHAAAAVSPQPAAVSRHHAACRPRAPELEAIPALPRLNRPGSIRSRDRRPLDRRCVSGRLPSTASGHLDPCRRPASTTGEGNDLLLPPLTCFSRPTCFLCVFICVCEFLYVFLCFSVVLLPRVLLLIDPRVSTPGASSRFFYSLLLFHNFVSPS